MGVVALNGFGACETGPGGIIMGGTFDYVDRSFGSPTITYGRYGEQAIYLTNTGFGHNVYGYNLSNLATSIMGADISYNYFGSPQPNAGRAFFMWLDGSTVQVSIGCDASGHIQAYLGGTVDPPAGSVIGTSAGVYFQDQDWHNISAKVTIDSTVGAVTVWYDGAPALTLTGVNTQVTGHAYATVAAIHFSDLTGIERFYDNLYVLDTSGSFFNDLQKPLLIDTHVPVLSGTNTNWTPFPGAPNWGNVGDWANKVSPGTTGVPDDSTTYNLSGAVSMDSSDTFVVNNFNTYGNNAIQFRFRAQSSSGSSTRQIKATIYKGATFYKGSAISVPNNTWGFFRDISFVENDPSTSTPWTGASLQTSEFGITNVGGLGGSANIQLSQLVIERLGSALDPFVPNHPMWLQG